MGPDPLDHRGWATSPASASRSVVSAGVRGAHRRVVEYWIQAIDALTRGERISMDDESYPDADRMPFNDTPIATAADDLRHQLLRLAEWNETATDDQWTAPLRMADERAEEIWHRSGIPDAAAALRHALHDAQHHLDDVERGLAAVSAP